MTEVHQNQGDTKLFQEKNEENEINPEISKIKENVDLKDPTTTTLGTNVTEISPKHELMTPITTTTNITPIEEKLMERSDSNTPTDEPNTTGLVKPKLRFNTVTFTVRMIFIISLIVVLSSIVATREKFAPLDTYEVLGDQRRLISWIPNTMDVLSNLPFILVSIVGVFISLNVSSERLEKENERINYLIFFISVGMATFGSAYYFWKPHTKRLFWHRLPRAISFTSLFYIMITEKFDRRSGGYLLGSIITFGFISGVYWLYTEMNYRGDLYILLQFAMTLVSPFILHFYESRYTHSEYFYAYFILGLISKVFESLDLQIFNLTRQTISGHTIHHILSAIAALSIALMLPFRTINVKKRKVD